MYRHRPLVQRSIGQRNEKGQKGWKKFGEDTLTPSVIHGWHVKSIAENNPSFLNVYLCCLQNIDLRLFRHIWVFVLIHFSYKYEWIQFQESIQCIISIPTKPFMLLHHWLSCGKERLAQCFQENLTTNDQFEPSHAIASADDYEFIDKSFILYNYSIRFCSAHIFLFHYFYFFIFLCVFLSQNREIEKHSSESTTFDWTDSNARAIKRKARALI